MNILSERQLAAFQKDGYVAVPGAVPARYCDAVVKSICRFLDIDLQTPATWRRAARDGHGIVPLHHDQALWDVRQLPLIHEVFAQLYQTRALWVSLDRVSFKPPAHIWSDEHSAKPIPPQLAPFHWDGDPRVAGTIGVQGVVYLTDTDINQGCLQVLPSFYQGLDEWLQTPRSDDEIRRPDLGAHQPVSVPGSQGTLILWHRRMPHTSGINHHPSHPRITQYVAMQPAGDEAARAQLARDTRQRRPPAWALRQSVPGQQNPEPGAAPTLNEHGQRLTGLLPWPDQSDPTEQ